jgi:hypothetical protein
MFCAQDWRSLAAIPPYTRSGVSGRLPTGCPWKLVLCHLALAENWKVGMRIQSHEQHVAPSSPMSLQRFFSKQPNHAD